MAVTIPWDCLTLIRSVVGPQLLFALKMLGKFAEAIIALGIDFHNIDRTS